MRLIHTILRNGVPDCRLVERSVDELIHKFKYLETLGLSMQLGLFGEMPNFEKWAIYILHMLLINYSKARTMGI